MINYLAMFPGVYRVKLYSGAETRLRFFPGSNHWFTVDEDGNAVDEVGYLDHVTVGKAPHARDYRIREAVLESGHRWHVAMDYVHPTDGLRRTSLQLIRPAPPNERGTKFVADGIISFVGDKVTLASTVVFTVQELEKRAVFLRNALTPHEFHGEVKASSALWDSCQGKEEKRS